MVHTYWHKQDAAEPLFPDLLWSRPEQRSSAGKLLIIGGNLYGFAAPAEAYGAALQAGLGTGRVVLPAAIKQTAGKLLPDLHYGASTPSGSFGQAALADLTELAEWADAVLFSGDLGRNSETAVLLEKFLAGYHGPAILVQDAADYCLGMATMVLNRSQTLLVLTMAQLQKLAAAAGWHTPFTFGTDVLRLAENMHLFTTAYPILLIVKQGDQLFAAFGGEVSSTRLQPELQRWRIKTAAYGAVWWLQNPAKPLEALTTAVYQSLSENPSETHGAAGRT